MEIVQELVVDRKAKSIVWKEEPSNALADPHNTIVKIAQKKVVYVVCLEPCVVIEKTAGLYSGYIIEAAGTTVLIGTTRDRGSGCPRQIGGLLNCRVARD
jgi:hypothetical protein